MPSIHVITDRERLKRIFSTLATEELSVRISGGLDAGLPELQHEVPEALFIQNHLNGLTGELIVRHVSIYASPATKLVLLREGQETCRGISHAIELVDSDEELTAAIQEAIDRFALGKIKKAAPQRRRLASDPEEPELTAEVATELPVPAEAAGTAEEPSFQDALKSFIDEMNVPLENVPPKPAPRPRPKYRSEKPFPTKIAAGVIVGLVIAIAAALFAGKKSNPVPAGGSAKKEMVAKAAPARSETPVQNPAVKTNAAPPATEAKKPAAAPAPAAVPPPAPAQPKPGVPAAKPALPPVQSAAPISPKPAVIPAPPNTVAKAPPVPAGKSVTPAAPPPSTAKAAPRTAIPGFVPREKMDKTYAAKNPGWERYLGKNTEFRVYKPEGVVKAVQAIDRKGVGIPKEFLDYALNQMVGSPQLTVQGTEKKGEYTVTRAAAAEGSRVLLYRKGGNKPLKAFVVYFEETGSKKK